MQHRSGRWSWSIVVAILAVLAWMPAPASASSVTPEYISGNPKCGDLGYSYGVKIEPPKSGTYSLDGFGTVTVTAGEGFIDWYSTVEVDAVIVKGGPNANVYHYEDGATSDSGLTTPLNPNSGKLYGLSHFDFCFDGVPGDGDDEDKAKKSGYKFEDKNGNGSWDDGEPGLSGWTIYVDYNDNQILDGDEPSDETDGAGYYEISGIKAGTWKVREVHKPGWVCTFPNHGVMAAGANGDGDCYDEQTFQAGDWHQDNHFGNFERMTVVVCKVEEMDGEAEMAMGGDDDDNAIAGWPIQLVVGGNVIDSIVTGENGCFTWDLGPLAGAGSFTVREEQQTGWTPVGHTEHTFTVESGADYEFTFVNRRDDNGNGEMAAKSGTKFEDKNGNGHRDDGEPGLAGWTIFVDYNDNQMHDADEPSAVTGEDGYYEILNIKAGTWKVREVQQEGWVCTLPGNGISATWEGDGDNGNGDVGAAGCYYQHEFKGGDWLTGNDFGNFKKMAVKVCKVEAKNGEADAATSGNHIANWPLFLTVDGVKFGDTVYTGEDGCFVWHLGPRAGGHSYDVHEEVQDGWIPVGEKMHQLWSESGETHYFTFVNRREEGAKRCTLTQGYWKTHSAYGPAPYNDTWAKIGEDTTFFLSGKSYYEVMWTPPAGGNAYYQLAHQYIAAKLNILGGASLSAEVEAAFKAAKELFETYTPTEIDALKGNDPLRRQFVDLAGILGSYNEGQLGPSHCDNDARFGLSSLEVETRSRIFAPVISR